MTDHKALIDRAEAWRLADPSIKTEDAWFLIRDLSAAVAALVRERDEALSLAVHTSDVIKERDEALERILADVAAQLRAEGVEADYRVVTA